MLPVRALLIDFDGTACLQDVSEMLRGDRDEMLPFALERAELDPTFPSLVAWAEERRLPIVLASDGFGFYVRPLLEAAGLGHLEVVTNELVLDGRPSLRHPNGHPECVGCGTCKMLTAVRLRERFGPVAFVGEGQSDRYGACTPTSCSPRMPSCRSASRMACRSCGGRRSTT